MQAAIESEAFRRAAMRSERLRIVGMLLVFGFFCAANLLAVAVDPTPNRVARTKAFVAWWVCLIAYELLMLRLTRRAERTGVAVRPWVWTLNTVVESSLPTIALLGLSADKAYLGPYRALHAAPVLVYSLFIILSTLRLSSRLSVLSGVTASAGYVAVYVFTRIVAPNNPAREGMPPETYIFIPVILLIAGFLAGGVARQIRTHLLAALAEAETRRKLDNLEHELRTARAIQMGLLPKGPPDVPGYDVAGWSRPADQTGGDYYDWLELPGGKVLFTIADATGHGIGPALLVAACRAYFRALASDVDPLERITGQVDALVAADVPAGRFITAAVALLDPARHEISLYSAGHAPLYVYRAAGNVVEAFEADQPPLGIGVGPADGEAGSVARRLGLEPGDALVLVTDGFFECANGRGEMLGTKALGEAIRRLDGVAAGELIGRLEREVAGFVGGEPQADDMTAVVIRRVR